MWIRTFYFHLKYFWNHIIAPFSKSFNDFSLFLFVLSGKHSWHIAMSNDQIGVLMTASCIVNTHFSSLWFWLQQTLSTVINIEWVLELEKYATHWILWIDNKIAILHDNLLPNCISLSHVSFATVSSLWPTSTKCPTSARTKIKCSKFCTLSDSVRQFLILFSIDQFSCRSVPLNKPNALWA